jgi:CDP-4-dehydro-6-deoxyglucose reductase, E1
MIDKMNKKQMIKSKKILKQYFEDIKKKQEEFSTKSPRIPLAIPPYDWEEVDESLDSLLNMETTMGKKVKLFEKKFAKYLGVKYALMVNSGSSANLVALSILTNQNIGKKRIQKKDEIITPAVTWATTVYPIINVGAKPVFVDVEKETYNIDPDKIEKAITTRTKAIFIVHLLGNPCNMEKIQKIAKKYDLQIIEDSCEAHGAEFNGKKVGTFGILSTFSFFASHHITTMEGGMIATDDEKVYELGKAIRTFGWSRELKNKEVLRRNNPNIDSRFLFVNTGYNLRPTELQGAFGIHQIKKLDKLVKIKIGNSKYWNNGLKKYEDFLILPTINKKYKNTFLSYPLTIKKNPFFIKNELVEFLEINGIETRPVMAGNMVEQPVTKMFDYKVVGKLKNSEYIMRNSFLIGNHQGIKKIQREYVLEKIIEFLEKKIKKK